MDKRFLFVGGLHRSGTTVVARALALHPRISGLTDTGVIEDEGQYLQGVYPPDGASGGPGEFAFDARSHLTEDSRLISDTAREELLRAWSPYWDIDRQVLLEKSPSNLIRMRFFAALFPNARFVIVMRHPIVAALATSKWVRWWVRLRRPLRLRRLIDHWLRAYELFIDDSGYLDRDQVMLLRYEDFIDAPSVQYERVCRFLDVPFSPVGLDFVKGANGRYLEVWREMSRRLFGGIYEGHIVRSYEHRALRFGYSLAEPDAVVSPERRVAALLEEA